MDAKLKPYLIFATYMLTIVMLGYGGHKLHPGLAYILPACALLLDYYTASRRRRQ